MWLQPVDVLRVVFSVGAGLGSVYCRFGTVSFCIDESMRHIAVFAEEEVVELLVEGEGKKFVCSHWHRLFVAVAVGTFVAVASERAVVSEPVGMVCLRVGLVGVPSCLLTVSVGCSHSGSHDKEGVIVGDAVCRRGGIYREGERFALRRERNHLLHIVCLYDIAALVSAPCV